MTDLERSATAYDRLSALTDKYNDGQAIIQQFRVLTRAIKALAATYGDGLPEHQAVMDALAVMTDAAGVERNRLYVEAHRLGNEMDTLNHLIQNGAYNDDRA